MKVSVKQVRKLSESSIDKIQEATLSSQKPTAPSSSLRAAKGSIHPSPGSEHPSTILVTPDRACLCFRLVEGTGCLREGDWLLAGKFIQVKVIGNRQLKDCPSVIDSYQEINFLSLISPLFVKEMRMAWAW